MFKIIFCPVIAICVFLGGRMPYPQDHKQQTRNRIVRSAASLFNRRGFAEVTIGEIMTAAGLTHGRFYRHFTSKEELYAEAVRHFLQKEAPASWQKKHLQGTASATSFRQVRG